MRSLPLSQLEQTPLTCFMSSEHLTQSCQIMDLMVSQTQPCTKARRYTRCGFGYLSKVRREVAAMAPTWCRTDVCTAEVRAPAHDAKLSQLPAAFSCLGQQVSVSVQNSILGKAYSPAADASSTVPRCSSASSPSRSIG